MIKDKYKIKFQFLLLFFLVNYLCKAQEIKLPNMVLPSPQASEISTYGNIPVDESTGRISPSIPLPNYEVGKLVLPMSLNYAGNGVKVEQKPTWTGINWILNAGGVITRIVKDLPDETSKPRYFYTKEELEAMQTPYQSWSSICLCGLVEANLSPPLHHIRWGFLHTVPVLIESGVRIPLELQNVIATSPETADSEVDEFNFNFADYSGSFFLKKNSLGIWEAKQIKYENELKIEIIGNFNLTTDYEFKITTPDGTSYFFGGYVNLPEPNENGYAVEETQLLDRTSGHPILGERAKTAFYLTKVENYLGDKIFLEYHTKDKYEVFIATNTQITTGIMVVANILCPTDQSIPVTPNIVKNVIYNAKFLKQIWNPQTSQKIIFNSFEANNKYKGVIGLKTRVLSSIDYGYGNIVLEYTPTKNSLQNTQSDIEKFFLQDVVFKNKNNTIKNNQYKMEYNDPLGLPSNTFSNAQDYLGYYNGITNNYSLLPKNGLTYSKDYFDELQISGLPLLPFANFSNVENYLGDRSTSFANASKGLLQKITYPTGGSTTFEYEPIIKDKFVRDLRTMSMYNNIANRIPISNPTGYTYIDFHAFDTQNSATVNPNTSIVFVNQEININLSIKIHNRQQVNNKQWIYVNLIGENQQVIETKKWFFPNYSDNYTQTEFNGSLSFNLGANKGYCFKMGFDSNVLGAGFIESNPSVEVSAGFNFISGLDEFDGSGIRIKRVKDFENLNANPTNIKRFYYSGLRNIIKKEPENNKFLFKPFFHSLSFGNCNWQEAVVGTENANSLNASLHTNSFTQNSNSSDVVSFFPGVTISLGGDNFEGGAIEKQFLFKPDQRMYAFSPTYSSGSVINIANQSLTFNDSYKTNFSDFNGKLLKETYWNKKNGLFKQKEITYNYVVLEDRDVVNNINARNTYNPELDFYPKNLFFGLYKTYSKKINTIQQSVKDYIEEVPITKYTTPPFVLVAGWQTKDHDGDGIPNLTDPDFITPEQFALLTDEQLEANYKKIITTQETNYYNNVAGLASSIKTTKSDNTTSEVKNYYPLPNCISQVSGLNSQDINALNRLTAQNRVSSPFQVETYNNVEKLTTQRIIYKTDEILNHTFEYKVQTAKGNNLLDNRIVYHKYDARKNPVEISLQNGTHVVYIWSYQRQPIYKIENATYAQVVAAMSGSGVLDPSQLDPNIPQPTILTNPFIVSLPNAMVTIYNYDPITQLLKTVIDPKGDVITYEYDEFNRLKQVKDKNGNVLSEKQYNYRP